MSVNDYIDSGTIKSSLPDTTWSSDYDAAFGRLATAASRLIDRFCRRPPGAFSVDTDETRYFRADRRKGHPSYFQELAGITGQHVLPIDELAAPPTSVSMTISTPRGPYTELSTTDYFVWPDNYAGLGLPITRLILDIYNGHYLFWYDWDQAVKIVGKFGYSTTPPYDIAEATLETAVRMFKRSQASYQDLGGASQVAVMTVSTAISQNVAAMLKAGGYVRTVV